MDSTFTIMEVIGIVILVSGLVSTYFGLRQLIMQVKYDTGVVRDWVDDSGREQLKDLHDWHDNRDEDGRFRWTNSVQFEDAMMSIAESNKDLVRLLETIHDRSVSIEGKVDQVLAQDGG